MTPTVDPGTELAQALSNSLATAKLETDQWNAQLIGDYTYKFNQWCFTQLNHPDGTPAPVPPMGWVVMWVPDPTSTTGVQWASPVQGTQPVCAPLTPPASLIHLTMGLDFMRHFAGTSAPAGTPSPFNATVPKFSQVTASDGSVWLRVG